LDRFLELDHGKDSIANVDAGFNGQLQESFRAASNLKIPGKAFLLRLGKVSEVEEVLIQEL
jgi:hypothetical protein